jgi:A/G-specific adenine glycosylase
MEINRFQSSLLDWYAKHQRTLPWRLNHDPYRIWLSEIMLQQTQVVTVIDYFNRFTSAYPNVFALAAAQEDDVYKLWEGLGYYSRARNLMKCAKQLVAEHNGQFPKDLKTLLKLPGIGPYTSGAILSIAYNLPVPAVDGNVLRVISRLSESYADIASPKTRPLIETVVQELLPEDCRHFNQALMELGATICTPKTPSCETCPVAEDCSALKNNVVHLLPIKEQKLKKTAHTTAVAYVTCNEKVLLVKRGGEGLLSGLWGFPIAELPLNATKSEQLMGLKDWLDEYLNLSVTQTHPEPLGQVKHVFTHKTWQMTLWHFEAPTQVVVDLPEIAWVTRTELKNYAIATAFVKLIQKVDLGVLNAKSSTLV